MTKVRERSRVGRFTSEAARSRFLAAYDELFELWPTPRQEWDVETSFGTTHVHRYGPAEGEPIVLLHGADANASTWYRNVAGLGECHPVFAVDAIGHPGRSVQRAPMTKPMENAAWLDELLAGLGLDKVHLVGHSYGGWLALNQAMHSPGRLATISLLDPGGFTKTPVLFYVHMLISVPAGMAPRRLRSRLGDWLANVALKEPRLLSMALLAARTYRPVRPGPSGVTDDDLRLVHTPSLILLAERTTLLKQDELSVRARSLMVSAEVEIVPGTGHGLPLERPQYVNTRILDFVESVRQR